MRATMSRPSIFDQPKYTLQDRETVSAVFDLIEDVYKGLHPPGAFTLLSRILHDHKTKANKLFAEGTATDLTSMEMRRYLEEVKHLTERVRKTANVTSGTGEADEHMVVQNANTLLTDLAWQRHFRSHSLV